MMKTNSIETYTFNVNGFTIDASYSSEEIATIFTPLLQTITKLQKQLNRRIVVFIAAPPGCGKTPLASFLQYLSETNDDFSAVQAIGIDGFHYHQDYLNKHEPLAKYKGRWDTFDVSSLKGKLSSLKSNDVYWPIYDRNIHDSIDNQILVNGEIIILEGNYLLYNKNNWEDIYQYCDYSVFITADEKLLEKRLISRKQMGGSSLQEAIDHYNVTDKPNIVEIINNHYPADLTLNISEAGNYSKI